MTGPVWSDGGWVGGRWYDKHWWSLIITWHGNCQVTSCQQSQYLIVEKLSTLISPWLCVSWVACLSHAALCLRQRLQAEIQQELFVPTIFHNPQLCYVHIAFLILLVQIHQRGMLFWPFKEDQKIIGSGQAGHLLVAPSLDSVPSQYPHSSLLLFQGQGFKILTCQRSSSLKCQKLDSKGLPAGCHDEGGLWLNSCPQCSIASPHLFRPSPQRRPFAALLQRWHKLLGLQHHLPVEWPTVLWRVSAPQPVVRDKFLMWQLLREHQLQAASNPMAALFALSLKEFSRFFACTLV